MQTFKITFRNFSGTHQTVTVKDIDSVCAQMQVILKYNVRQIVIVQVQA